MNIPNDILAQNIIELQVKAYKEGHEAGLREGAKKAVISVSKVYENDGTAEYNNERFTL